VSFLGPLRGASEHDQDECNSLGVIRCPMFRGMGADRRSGCASGPGSAGAPFARLRLSPRKPCESHRPKPGFRAPTPDRPQMPRRAARGIREALARAKGVVVHRRPGRARTLGVGGVRRAIVGAWFEQVRVRLRSGDRWPHRWPRRVQGKVVQDALRHLRLRDEGDELHPTAALGAVSLLRRRVEPLL